ncbi:hypothetical protein NW768_008129 [Fusarium equiseti]|uniref:Uncharacterized protein n=1 Tax=Fusarium equiseti TaxID=61235 RepID=A0ABQ8R656_FUSEQ|nr:hypothetical protein NW768_008129 [Fusarium equiseti]
MKVSLQFLTAALAASAAAHPQAPKKPGSTTLTTTASATSTIAAPSRAAISNLPFMSTWFFSSQTKCMSAFNACLFKSSKDQMPCVQDYGACLRSSASSIASAPSAPTSTAPGAKSTLSAPTGTQTHSRPALPTGGLRAWWGQEQNRRKCRYEHYTCIREKSNDRAACDDKKASCLSSAKTASATATATATGSTTIAPNTATTTATGSTTAVTSTATTSTTVPDAPPAGTDAPLAEDDATFDDDSDDQ